MCLLSVDLRFFSQDLHLIELLDAGKIPDVLSKASRGKEFYAETLNKLVEKEVPNLIAEWSEFQENIAEAIRIASRKSGSTQCGRVKCFIESFQTECLVRFLDSSLVAKITIDSNEYEACDAEEEADFLKECNGLIETLKNGNRVQSDPSYYRKRVLQYMRDVRRDEVARPRCKSVCPHCRCICIHPANHPSTIKHNSFHQPIGVTGWRFHCDDPQSEWHGTLVSHTCSTGLTKGHKFWCNNKFHKYDDFEKMYSGWSLPRLTERLPLREYLFATYHQEMAKMFHCKPCLNVPIKYHHNLETIRSDLQKYCN